MLPCEVVSDKLTLILSLHKSVEVTSYELTQVLPCEMASHDLMVELAVDKCNLVSWPHMVICYLECDFVGWLPNGIPYKF